MEQLEFNYTPIAVLAIGFAAKKLMKKELVPVTGWKQMLSTYLTVGAGVVVASMVKKKIDENTTKPKPN